MRRRELIAGTALLAASTLSGCTGSSPPPPRKSNVFQAIEARNGKLQVALEGRPWVVSRYDEDSQSALADLRRGAALVTPSGDGGSNPVDSVRTKGNGGGDGRGATGRASGGYDDAPKTHHGRAWLHGGAYADSWYADHDDEVTKYDVVVSSLGVAFLGSSAEMEADAPGPGPAPWDCRVSNPKDIETCTIEREGWYRVGAELRGQQGHDFDWECVDLNVEGRPRSSGYDVEKQWKVSPRI